MPSYAELVGLQQPRFESRRRAAAAGAAPATAPAPAPATRQRHVRVSSINPTVVGIPFCAAHQCLWVDIPGLFGLHAEHTRSTCSPCRAACSTTPSLPSRCIAPTTTSVSSLFGRPALRICGTHASLRVDVDQPVGLGRFGQHLAAGHLVEPGHVAVAPGRCSSLSMPGIFSGLSTNSCSETICSAIGDAVEHLQLHVDRLQARGRLVRGGRSRASGTGRGRSRRGSPSPATRPSPATD